MTELMNPETQIKGWGIDADEENDPTYPMRNIENEDKNGLNWERPALQPVNVEILKSIERPNLTATFGTSTPPRGLSGVIRRWAYRHSESTWSRWFPLMLADRVDMIEGIFRDLARGHIPNILAERGIKSEIKHNPKGFAIKVGIAAIIAAGLVAYITRDD